MSIRTKKLCISLVAVCTLLISISAFASNYTLGPEFRINTYTSQAQQFPSVTSNGTDYLVTWQSYYQDGSHNGIYGQNVDANGNLIGAEFQINTYTLNSQDSPSVTSNGTDYLVTWQSYLQDGSSSGIYGQKVDANGNLVGSEFQINTYTSSYQENPSVTSNGTDYLVTWNSDQDGSYDGIYGQKVDANGNLVGSEFQINTYTSSYQENPSVTSNGTDYLVTWTSYFQDGSYDGIYGQKVDANGNLVGTEFLINTYTNNNQRFPSVTSNGTDYLVTWQSNLQDGSGWGIYGQNVDANGNLVGTEFLINTYTSQDQRYPSVTSNGADYLVTWQSNLQDGSSNGIYGQNVDANGNLVGPEFQINTYTNNAQQFPSVTSNGTDYLVTWQSNPQDGSSSGIYGKLLTSDAQAVPEPASIILLLSGLGALITRRNRK